jgi:HEPN domain-containing protein
MNSSDDIIKLAKIRLEEAEILLANNKSNGAFYLLGYTVELYLKYKICKVLNIDDLFDPKCNLKQFFEGRNPFFSHDLNTLMVFSGLKRKFDEEKSQNKELFKTTSLLIDVWSEKSRYDIQPKKNDDVKDALELLKNENGLLSWILKN